MENNSNLFKYFSLISQEYDNRFEMYKNYLEYVKGLTILKQNFFKNQRDKIEKLVKRISRDEITLRILHFLENTKFNLFVSKNSKNQYILNLESDNILKNSFLMIKSKFIKKNVLKFLKE